MSSVVQLCEERAAIYQKMKALHARADREGRAFTTAEDHEWSDLDRKQASLKEEIAQKERAQRQISLASATDYAGDPEFAEFLKTRGSSEIELPWPPGVERRDLLAGSTGAAAIPPGFLAALREYLIEVSGIRQAGATVIVSDSGAPLKVPRASSHGTATLVAEGGTILENDPTFSAVTLDSYKYANLAQLSREFIEDEGAAAVDYLARATGRNLGNVSGAHFITGTGTGQPRGVVTAASTGKTFTTGAVAGAIPPGDIIDLFHSVIPQYRTRAAWLMNDLMAAKLRKIRDDSGGAGTGNLLWQPGLQAGQPDMLLGRPVVIDPNVAAPGANAKSVVFGDFSGYYIKDTRGIRFERSDDFAFGTDLVSFRGILRTDGDLIDDSAVKLGVFGAT
jgi:HK97 family phage major capsid protein